MMKNKEIQFEKYIPYEVDFDYLDKKVDFFLTFPNGETQKMFFNEILNFFQGKKFIDPTYSSFLNSFRIKYEDAKYVIQSENLIARRVLSLLLNLQNENKSIDCLWYLYDYNTCNENPQFIHSFFLACGREIIAEKVEVSTSWMQDCDQNIIIKSIPATCLNSSTPLWSNMEKDQKAITIWCYQKFYQETEIGQFLSIRENLNIPMHLRTHSVSNYTSLLFSIDRSLKLLILSIVIIILKMML